jgi:uncharacterized protein (TIGR02058 family)
MAYKRYLIEFDTGVDLHGMNVTKAAQKAVKGAISHCCMCGIPDLLNIKDPFNALKIEVKLGAPFPEKVDIEEVKKALPPYKDLSIDVVQGGMTAKGLHVDAFGDGDTIVMVNAALTVSVNTELVSL